MKKIFAVILSIVLVLSLGSTAFAGLESDGTLTFSSVDLEGKPVTEEIFKDNKLTLVNFWEAWCYWCVKELPTLVELCDTYSGEGFGMLGVSYAETYYYCDNSGYSEDMEIYDGEEETPDIAAEYGLQYPTVFFNEDFESIDSYAGNAVARPQLFLVDSEGKMIQPSEEDWYNIFDTYNDIICSAYDVEPLSDEEIEENVSGIMASVYDEDDEDMVNHFEVCQHDFYEWCAIVEYYLNK